jgi:chemotaxis protein methyltransferase CheR
MAFFTVQSQKKDAINNEPFSQFTLDPKDFDKICQIVYQFSGIRLSSGKEELVRSRLMKRLRILGIESFSSYLRYVKNDSSAQELKIMIDSLTTNKTSFFRENQHFDYLRSHILPNLKARDSHIRLWSAGCSSGEEPYSIAMLLNEEWPTADRAQLRILATDISTRILSKAQTGEYEKENLQGIPSPLLDKYFTLVTSQPVQIYRVKDNIKTIVRFAQLNLMDAWPMKGPFDVIFCRNVMIYFDQPTQRELVRRFFDMLIPGGHLLVGHSESLVASAGQFKYIQPATYVK